jgi:hypothetical protein
MPFKGVLRVLNPLLEHCALVSGLARSKEELLAIQSEPTRKLYKAALKNQKFCCFVEE